MSYEMDKPTRIGIQFGERPFDTVERNMLGFNASAVKIRPLFKNLIEMPDSVQLIQQGLLDFNDRIVNQRLQGLVAVYDVYTCAEGTQVRVTLLDERFKATVFSVVCTAFLEMPVIDSTNGARFGKRFLKAAIDRTFDVNHNNYSYFPFTGLIKELTYGIMNVEKDQEFFFITQANAVVSMFSACKNAKTLIQITSIGEKEIMTNCFGTRPSVAGVNLMTRELQARHTFH